MPVSISLPSKVIWLGDKVNFVNTLVFRSDGTFSSENYTTAIGSDQILGYRGYFSEIYTIVNERVTIYYNEWFTMGIADINYVPKNNLRFEEGNYIVGYAIQKNYTQLSYICPEDPECKPESYIKIN